MWDSSASVTRRVRDRCPSPAREPSQLDGPSSRVLSGWLNVRVVPGAHNGEVAESGKAAAR